MERIALREARAFCPAWKRSKEKIDMITIRNQVFDQERALYGSRDTLVEHCRFEGPADGESALKECRDIQVNDCDFMLRYPLWHVEGAQVADIRMTETCRAALWYDKDMTLTNCVMGGIKALRECERVTIRGGEANSQEFGWMCRGVRIENFKLTSEYPFFNTRNMEVSGLTMKGKYSFQYVENAAICDSVLDTKDAFWHSKNVTVRDTVIKGEYLAWYSESLRLVRCKIIGTQPLCYCKGLVLEDCEMEDADLSFENSDVTATVRGHIVSVKNPVHGAITAGSIGEIILDEHRWPQADCVIRDLSAK